MFQTDLSRQGLVGNNLGPSKNVLSLLAKQENSDQEGKNLKLPAITNLCILINIPVVVQTVVQAKNTKIH